ncbi:coiled-coil domain-containing protein 55-domain containing protein [Lobosporangium transversale]|uniref:Coiled-coil domain-containing protein 55-domain containing protein n=1 Tax=Lobosporangium transversale TaxID=64571 RepID=A0A1Y2FZ95_9FUNG|nr:coiled-coil domain-containing protein 55-domain containing protein [Lobosporangium transversale]ORY88536.1 coiled-coil domain-containing protein 55-domain containing protein [Lobosporangium transversale]|eukprot:XP_021874998.1 coiled-coil domain-containing protein 55-domain containing protein [Lobosporangium transversale]
MSGLQFGLNIKKKGTILAKPKPAAINKTLRPYATATLQSTAVIEQQNAALAEDATVFDYDGVYDQLKAGERARELARKKDSAERKPKYVAALLQAAETRKRDRQIAEEKRLEHGQIVDKRELLKGGLNIIKKSQPSASQNDLRLNKPSSSYDRDRAYAAYKDAKYGSSSFST